MISTAKKTTHLASHEQLNILLIDENVQRAESIVTALGNSRYKVSHLACTQAGLLKQVDEIQPDIIVIDIESPNRDMLESLRQQNNFNKNNILNILREV